MLLATFVVDVHCWFKCSCFHTSATVKVLFFCIAEERVWLGTNLSLGMFKLVFTNNKG